MADCRNIHTNLSFSPSLQEIYNVEKKTLHIIVDTMT